MNCNEFKKKLAQWLEEIWNVEAPGDAAAPVELTGHAEECPECRVRLHTALSLTVAQPVLETPSPYLATQIQDKLSGSKPKARGRGIAYSSLAAMLIIALIAVGLMAGPFRGSRGADGALLVRFTLEAPAAKQVHVVGDWNDWDSTANPLQDEDSDGVWETDIKLKPGKEYRYQFYIDDSEWVADPQAPLKIDDGFGGQNSILRI